ncbi:hypothetical protein [Cupriavidus necator]
MVDATGTGMAATAMVAGMVAATAMVAGMVAVAAVAEVAGVLAVAVGAEATDPYAVPMTMPGGGFSIRSWSPMEPYHHE